MSLPPKTDRVDAQHSSTRYRRWPKIFVHGKFVRPFSSYRENFSSVASSGAVQQVPMDRNSTLTPELSRNCGACGCSDDPSADSSLLGGTHHLCSAFQSDARLRLATFFSPSSLLAFLLNSCLRSALFQLPLPLLFAYSSSEICSFSLASYSPLLPPSPVPSLIHPVLPKQPTAAVTSLLGDPTLHSPKSSLFSIVLFYLLRSNFNSFRLLIETPSILLQRSAL